MCATRPLHAGQWCYATRQLKATCSTVDGRRHTRGDEGPPLDAATGQPVQLVAADTFAAAWKESALGRALLQEVEAGVQLAAADMHPSALVTQRFALSAMAALLLALRRQWTLFVRNKGFLTFRLVQVAHA